jgi:hypothetical protein
MTDQTLQSLIELKPCPFCGDEVILGQDYDGGTWLYHKKGHVDGQEQKCILTDISVIGSISAWNTRQHKPEPVSLDAQKVMKMIVPISTLIGCARSADGLTPDSNIEGWKSGIDKAEKEATKALDALIEYCMEAPHE